MDSKSVMVMWNRGNLALLCPTITWHWCSLCGSWPNAVFFLSWSISWIFQTLPCMARAFNHSLKLAWCSLADPSSVCSWLCCATSFCEAHLIPPAVLWGQGTLEVIQSRLSSAVSTLALRKYAVLACYGYKCSFLAPQPSLLPLQSKATSSNL